MKTFTIATSIGLMLVASAGAQSLRQEGQGGQVAPLATTDPSKVVYRVSGVTDSGGSYQFGIATSIMCTNFSQSTENVYYTVLGSYGTILNKYSYNIAPRETATASTRYTYIFTEDIIFEISAINQGSIVVSSTTTNIHCSAMIVDAASTVPNGIALHMVRFNAHPGSVE